MSSSANTFQPPTHVAAESLSAEELTQRADNNRYEGLVLVRTKAINGKGAWYWAHFEPLLMHNSDKDLPKAVKLRCSLCDAVFSASNPSRTASKHLKRGTCPNFSSVPKSILSIMPSSNADTIVLPLPPPSSSARPQNHHRRRRVVGPPHRRLRLITKSPSGICDEFTVTMVLDLVNLAILS